MMMAVSHRKRKMNELNTERFIWRKKIERDIDLGVSLHSYSRKAEKKRRIERMAEAEDLKRKREGRALEKAQLEQDRELLVRERLQFQAQELEKKEEEFAFHQANLKSKIRLQEGRSRPIDILIKQIDPSEDVDIEINEPYMIFEGLKLQELEDLADDIRLHLQFDKAGRTQYWEALLLICNWELVEAVKKDSRIEEHPGLHSSIQTEVINVLRGRSFTELEEDQSRIESKMLSGEAKVVEFWESVLRHIQVFKASAFLKEIHAQKRFQYLKKLAEGTKSDDDHDRNGIQEDEDQEAGIGSYSPELHQSEDSELAIGPEMDRTKLERDRTTVLVKRRLQKKIPRPTLEDDNNFEKKALKSMGAMEGGDAVFGLSDEIYLDSSHYKFRSRKPKYFNRVHTGYEWNKYNQTHYDHENPPPKTVMGYKFNVFYPDLIDKSKAPNYSIEKDGDSEETCIIRFHGGPPYQDIAFRIVGKEWEYSQKKGFKCTFERGILHLYLNFKRYRYRR